MRWIGLAMVVTALVLAAIAAAPAEARVVRGSVGERTYRLFVPDTPAAPGERRPVVFVLHGGGDRENGDTIAAQSRFDAEAQARRWIAVYPDARGGDFQVAGYQHGNARRAREELTFLRRLLARVGDRHRIDRALVFATGFSNGGFLAYALACERRPLVAAIAPVGTTETVPRCANTTRPVSVLHLHARDDERLPLARGLRGWPSPVATMRRWRARNGCTGWREHEAPGVTRWNASGCRGDAHVALNELHGGGHAWPRDSTTEIATFLSLSIASRRDAQ